MLPGSFGRTVRCEEAARSVFPEEEPPLFPAIPGRGPGPMSGNGNPGSKAEKYARNVDLLLHLEHSLHGIAQDLNPMHLTQRSIEYIHALVSTAKHHNMSGDVLGIVLDGVVRNDAEDGRLVVDEMLAVVLIVEGLVLQHFQHASDDGWVSFALHLEAERYLARHTAINVDKTLC